MRKLVLYSDQIEDEAVRFFGNILKIENGFETMG